MSRGIEYRGQDKESFENDDDATVLRTIGVFSCVLLCIAPSELVAGLLYTAHYSVKSKFIRRGELGGVHPSAVWWMDTCSLLTIQCNPRFILMEERAGVEDASFPLDWWMDSCSLLFYSAQSKVHSGGGESWRGGCILPSRLMDGHLFTSGYSGQSNVHSGGGCILPSSLVDGHLFTAGYSGLRHKLEIYCRASSDTTRAILFIGLIGL
ncbi:hypothetical protein AVEN_11531-1 [Araneus ventricosus]|uniref:Uncharacterized protein n=1 Tax=Araneus ventricosus TaxID=182803 RepID=A0A4Y2H1C5_ARAVE|nr:hypothetical protein AVEN_11531-1 [Araneus ventricosus]